MPQSDVAGNIRAELARRKRTQTGLAERLGMKRQNLSQRLHGRVPFRLHELQTAADYLDMSLVDLIGTESVA